MKNIAAQMINFDREQMRRIANNMPEQYDEKPQVPDTEELRQNPDRSRSMKSEITIN
ncbi:phage replication protein [Escherichia coli]|nr:replication protein O [Escherichia coli UMEA 3682-1]GDR96999.1 phage replication protein [Escherichia coli]